MIQFLLEISIASIFFGVLGCGLLKIILLGPHVFFHNGVWLALKVVCVLFVSIVLAAGFHLYHVLCSRRCVPSVTEIVTDMPSDASQRTRIPPRTRTSWRSTIADPLPHPTDSYRELMLKEEAKQRKRDEKEASRKQRRLMRAMLSYASVSDDDTNEKIT